MQRLGKRIFEICQLPEPEISLAYHAWLNSANCPKGIRDRAGQIRTCFALLNAYAAELTPSQRAYLTAKGERILAQAGQTSRPNAKP
jgi:hypothetical protein